MSRIGQAFDRLEKEDRKGLVAYLTAGDPDLASTPALVVEAARAGADIIELGVPFSEPVADGPVIQEAMERSLASGTKLAGIFAAVRQVRRDTEVPIAVFGYFNPVMQYGPERFTRDAKLSGADGLIVVDLPMEESDALSGLARAQGLDYIPLVAPTSSIPRLERAARIASGFVYFVSRTGVTGSGTAELDAVGRGIQTLRGAGAPAVAVGFGVQTGDDARQAAELGDAVVVGSHLVRTVHEAEPGDRVLALGRAVRLFRQALD